MVNQYLACEILARKIAPIYQLLNWKWVNVGVPNEKQIYEKLVNFLSYLENKAGDNIDSVRAGGLEASRRRTPDGHWEYEIKFVIREFPEYWRNYDVEPNNPYSLP